ncbi:MAG: response regulator transcription factor [Planctomycetes bacterium]|nr:response regulator transcription factor [Planctomycetota bacterium]
MIVDDHPSVREGLASRISAQPDMTVCGEAAGLAEALGLIESAKPDVVIVDISLKSGDGLNLVKEIAARHKRVKTLVHSMYDETTYAHRCVQAGAKGYVNKAACPTEVVEAIREILAGGIYLSEEMSNQILRRVVGSQEPTTLDPVDTLTDRQLEVFRLIGDGLTATQIAERLHISIHTVETHRENIKGKLEVKNIAALTQRAAQWVLKNG